MKTTILLTIGILLCSVTPGNIQAQIATGNYAELDTVILKAENGFHDSEVKSTTDSIRSGVIQGGIGFGYLMKGGFFGLRCKLVSAAGWGTSLDYRSGLWMTRNLPSDYNPLFYPMDYINVASLHVVRVLTGHGKNPRFSAGVGPSLVRINNAIITPNPDYDPNDIWNLSKYFKSRKIEKSVGLSMNMDTEIVLTSFMILGISLTANFNDAASFLGLGLYFDFGDVRD